jgi:hypothetical protein
MAQQPTKANPPRATATGSRPAVSEDRHNRQSQYNSLSDLVNERIWVAWRQEQRNGKLTKLPKNPATGGNAMVPTNPDTYGTRAAAEKRWQRFARYAKDPVGGIGIVLGELPNGQYWSASILILVATRTERLLIGPKV